MRPNQFFALRNPRTGKEYWPSDERVWRFEPGSMQREVDADSIIWPEDLPESRMTRPRYKTRYDPNAEATNPVSTWIDNADEVDADIDRLVAGLNQEATKELRDLFGEQVMDYPKPSSLVRGLLAIGSRQAAIVLDFFAGSGTTAQAVLELNKQDGGDRKFILVQLPEPTERKDFPTIADITRERVRRVIKKLDEGDAGKLPLGDGAASDHGFKAFKLASSNFKIWDGSRAPMDAAGLAEKLKQMVLNLEDGREDEAILYEIILKSGLSLTAKVEKLDAAGKTAWRVADGVLIVCLDRALTQEALRAIIALKPQRVVCLDLGFAGNDALKTNTVLEMKSHDVEFATA
jgi:adenine-specific DNA-methyltransferase